MYMYSSLILTAIACGILVLVWVDPVASRIFKENSSKVELQSLSLTTLSQKQIESLNQDLTCLKISNSKFETVDRFAFDGLRHLNLLDLSDNDIKKELDPQTFSRLPGLEILILKNLGLKKVYLNLTNVQELILSHNEIVELKKNNIIGKNVNYLDIRSNNIEALDSGLESFGKLTTIDFSKNKVSRIENETFAGNPNLEKILASGNRIASTDGLKLHQLKTLNLFSNRIASLSTDSFTGMPALEELILAFNFIQKVEDLFFGLFELKFLNLAGNEIEELSSNVFRDNIYLTKLSLQRNKLKRLEPFVSELHHLTHLDLSHNHLVTIHEDFFSMLPGLKVLDLSFNGLKTVAGLFAPAIELEVLGLAGNGISFTGSEFSHNLKLNWLNLSSNSLEIGLRLFENNSKLISLDLSNNKISDFCDTESGLKNLIKLNLRGNLINRLPCLQATNFTVLCEVDIRNNPLTCGKELEDLILDFVTKKSSPYQVFVEFQSDIHPAQCEELSLNRSINLWNAVKRQLCPREMDVQILATKVGEWDSEKPVTQEAEVPPTKYVFSRLIGHAKKIELTKDRLDDPQSERKSWEKIDEDPELLNGFEEEEPEKKTRYSWYTIVIILIGLSLTLTCFNLAVCLYIRLKVWKRNDIGNPQKYTVLQNKVYKNTTEPSQIHQLCEREWLVDSPLKNKFFSHEKVNEFLINFAGSRKIKTSESSKNVLIDPNNP